MTTATVKAKDQYALNMKQRYDLWKYRWYYTPIARLLRFLTEEETKEERIEHYNLVESLRGTQIRFAWCNANSVTLFLEDGREIKIGYTTGMKLQFTFHVCSYTWEGR